MREAFILSGCRTPIGRFRGGLSDVPAVELGARTIAAAVERAGIDPRAVEEVIFGCVLTGGLGQAPGRQAALRGGIPPATAAVTINKVCGSSLKAAMLAAQAVRCGDAESIVAGGMESMSGAGHLLPRALPPYGDRTLIDLLQFDGLTCASSGRLMGDIADGLAEEFGLTREELDRYAVESHRRAWNAITTGRFRDEIVPITLERNGELVTVERDEGPRKGTSQETLAALPAVFRKGGSVTAGNSSMISDGAAALVIASREAAERHGVEPLARIVASVTSGGEPENLFTAPVEAIRRVAAMAGRRLDEIDLFELNEAFASQMLACLQQLELDSARVNVHGGAIALGHPIGASGARVLVTLVHALCDRSLRTGVAALCLGGGNAVAMLIERC